MSGDPTAVDEGLVALLRLWMASANGVTLALIARPPVKTGSPRAYDQGALIAAELIPLAKLRPLAGARVVLLRGSCSKTQPVAAGIVDRTDTGRVVFPYESVKVEFLLQAA